MAVTAINNDKSSDSGIRSNKKLRILLCSENCGPQINGIARRVDENASGFRRNGHTVDLLHPYLQGETWCLPHPWNQNADLMLIRPLSYWKYVAMHQDYDVIHVVMPLNLSGAWIMAMSKILRSLHSSSNNNNKYPALVISHHLNGEEYINTYSPPGIRDFQKVLIFTCLSRILPMISDRILAPTRSTEPRLLCQWPSSKIGICHTGIAPDFSPKALQTDEGQYWLARKRDFLNTSGKQYLLLYVGRVAPEKGVHRLLAAMAEYLGKTCALWIVGDGPYRPAAEALVYNHNKTKEEHQQLNVDFVGFQRGAHLASVYAIADCFVCPSHTETYGQVVQEAIASGVRVALPAMPQFLEAYHDIIDPQAYWTPHDTKSMADTITALVSLPSRTLEERLAVRSQLLDWVEACEAMLTEYSHALTVVQKSDEPLGTLDIAIVAVWMFFSWFVYLSGHLVYFVTALLGKVVRLPSFYVD